MLRGHVARLEAFDEAALSPDERVDRHVLLEEIEKAVFGEEVLRGEAWDALELVYLMGSGLFGLLSREYAPWSQRGAALLSRLAGPARAARARPLAGLTGLPDRPVALLQLETALAQLEGVTELVDAGLAEARSRAEAGEAADLVAPMEARRQAAREALEAFRAGLDGDVRAARRRARAAWARALRPQAAPHPRQRPRARRAARARLGRLPRRARRDAAPGPRDLVGLGARRAAAGRGRG